MSRPKKGYIVAFYRIKIRLQELAIAKRGNRHKLRGLGAK